MVVLTSAAGLVGFLSEPDDALRIFALQRLNEEIDLLWPEVSSSISTMYVLLILMSPALALVRSRLARAVALPWRRH